MKSYRMSYPLSEPCPSLSSLSKGEIMTVASVLQEFIVCSLHALFHSILTTNLKRGEYSYYPYVTDEELGLRRLLCTLSENR